VFIFCGQIIFSAENEAQDSPDENKLYVMPLASYNYINLEKQSVHIPGLGLGLMKGDYGKDFTDVNSSLFIIAMYQPVFFDRPLSDESVPGIFHQADLMAEARMERHQLLGIFTSSSDKPVSGGISTFGAGMAWGYEVIRRNAVSLILGAGLAVGDFGLTLPDGRLLPICPLPLIRFGLNTRWFDASFDFLTGPNLSLTVAPEQKVRFTADMRMDYYRSIEDLIAEYIIWYRFFGAEHPMGDFAGIGVGYKNDSLGFDLSSGKGKSFELQQSSMFAVFDITVVKLEGGYIFNSRYLFDEHRAQSPGKGFYVSIQGMYRF
jgi:hypothetical protein